MNTKARRNLSKDKLMRFYSEEELRTILRTTSPQKSPPTLADHQWEEIFELRAQQEDQYHKWTPIEDKFIRDTYMYLTDTTIALALNVPTRAVYARRKTLDLHKRCPDHHRILIWHARDDFEEDCKQHRLTKARNQHE